jgi:hypothetical protein
MNKAPRPATSGAWRTKRPTLHSPKPSGGRADPRMGSQQYRGALLDIALDHLTLARVALYRALLEPGSPYVLRSSSCHRRPRRPPQSRRAEPLSLAPCSPPRCTPTSAATRPPRAVPWPRPSRSPSAAPCRCFWRMCICIAPAWQQRGPHSPLCGRKARRLPNRTGDCADHLGTLIRRPNSPKPAP